MWIQADELDTLAGTLSPAADEFSKLMQHYGEFLVKSISPKGSYVTLSANRTVLCVCGGGGGGGFAADCAAISYC